MDDETIEIHKKVEQFLYGAQQSSYPVKVHPATRIEKLHYSEPEKLIRISLSEYFSNVAFREENVDQIYTELQKMLGEDYKNYTLQIITLDKPLKELIPNYYRTQAIDWDLARLPAKTLPAKPIIQKLNATIPLFGLYGRNVALWHSHGWYYNQKQDRWMWQRARLFGTVEDLYPFSVTKPYLVPMLENAAANVFMPRERDTQIHEVVIDNDNPQDIEKGFYQEKISGNAFKWLQGETEGFLPGKTPYPVNYNPFNKGSYLFTKSDTLQTAVIEWIPDIPQDGYYAVHISYNGHKQNTDDALYTVYHSGDTSQFLVNQQMGGGSWLYLGNFKFKKGTNPESGKVTLSNKSRRSRARITADAVRFGGGMGIVERNGQSGGRPRFVEGARYWLQSAGFPDTLVYHLNDSSDYKDDYQSRGEWVNYLSGNPNGPNKNRSLGINIPIAASLAFHTDAGITDNDTTIGTLQIYSVIDKDTATTFPDGMSRYANRDLSDIMQTQIVNDMRQLFDPAWTRRALREAQYSEAFRPNVPATLLELLSHQNFLDMQFGLDPRFRFHAARAIYKSLLRFISAQNNEHYVVQPLPVNHFSAIFDSTENVLLRWKAVSDPLEATADPKVYKVYIREEENGFDNGRLVADTFFVFQNPKPGTIYSFKVTALNDGGESFPSEILALCKMETENPPVLIINGFDRIAPPANIKYGNYSGFLYSEDNGVPDKFDYGFTGEQFNFDATDKWHADDRPGHGASYGSEETQIIAGNSFDFPFIHGQAIKNAGYSFVSSSDEAIMNGQLALNNYSIVDLILGEEKETGWQRAELDSIKGTEFKTFPEKLKRRIRSYLSEGKALFLSGAYIGTDLFKKKVHSYPDISFARDILKFNWTTDHAVQSGSLFTPVNSSIKFPDKLAFNTTYNAHIYRVEAPDAIGPINGSKTIIRYKENGFSAGIAYKGHYKIIAFGFPYETIIEKDDRNEVMQSILKFFSNK